MSPQGVTAISDVSGLVFCKFVTLHLCFPLSYSMLIKMALKAVNLQRQRGVVENAGSEERWVLVSVLHLVSHETVGKSSIFLILIFYP